jgi:hypothetical protein
VVVKAKFVIHLVANVHKLDLTTKAAVFAIESLKAKAQSLAQNFQCLAQIF